MFLDVRKVPLKHELTAPDGDLKWEELKELVNCCDRFNNRSMTVIFSCNGGLWHRFGRGVLQAPVVWGVCTGDGGCRAGMQTNGRAGLLYFCAVCIFFGTQLLEVFPTK